MIEIVAEEAFHPYSNRFFEEMGMSQTSFLEDYMYIIPNQALPYSDWGDGVWQQYPTMTSTYGEGFLFTTLDDQLRYEQLVQRAKADNNALLLASQQPIPNSEKESYGFGLELGEWNHYPAVHHAGGTGSYGSQVIRFPEEGLSIFVISSNSRVWTGGLADEIAQLLLEEKKVEIAYDDKLCMIQEAPLVNSFLGQYYSADKRLVRVEAGEGDTLNWLRDNRSPIALIKEAENLYHTSYDKQVKIGFYDNELALLYPSGEADIYNRVDIGAPTSADFERFVGQYYNAELDVHFKLYMKDEKLMLALDGWKNPKPVEVFNKVDLLVRSYKMKVERDAFDRVVAIYLSYSRALNIRFAKEGKS
ncbi:MAG: serine hydrolase [Bacteroidota bacterium]